MNVLVFGGTGFVGSKLIEKLIKNGYKVYVVSRNSQKTARIFENKIQVLEWDYFSPLYLPVEKIEVVINLAGESIGNRRWTNSVKKEIRTSRIRTTRAIVSAINKGTIQPKVLINASAVGYYGHCGDDVITESEVGGNDFLAQVCRDWENEAFKVKNNLTRVVTLRIGVVLGNEGALNKMAFPFKYFMGGPLGKGNQWLSWIHIQDLTRLIIFIINHQELTGAINAVAPNPERMRDFSKILGKVLHSPSWLPVPEIMLKIALGQMAEMLLHGQRAVPKKLLNANFDYKFPTLKEALENVLRS